MIERKGLGVLGSAKTFPAFVATGFDVCLEFLVVAI